MLDSEKLCALITEIQDKIEKELIIANRTDTIQEVLKKYSFDKREEYSYCIGRESKVLVIGGTEVSKDELVKVIKKLKLNPKNFEFILDYEKIENFSIEKIRNNTVYSDIFVGPIPHKMKEIGKYSNIISKIQNNSSEYPKLTKLRAANELKITKNNFREALLSSELMKYNYINA